MLLISAFAILSNFKMKLPCSSIRPYAMIYLPVTYVVIYLPVNGAMIYLLVNNAVIYLPANIRSCGTLYQFIWCAISYFRKSYLPFLGHSLRSAFGRY